MTEIRTDIEPIKSLFARIERLERQVQELERLRSSDIEFWRVTNNTLRHDLTELTGKVEGHGEAINNHRDYIHRHEQRLPAQPAGAGGEDADEDDDYRPELMMDIDGDEITLHISSRFRIKREEFEEACAVELGLVPRREVESSDEHMVKAIEAYRHEVARLQDIVNRHIPGPPDPPFNPFRPKENA